MRGPREIEVKIALPDVATGRRLLRRAGFRVSVRRSFESNVIFDCADGALRARGQLLRLRRVRNKGVVTLKGPSESSTYKSRPETEVEVSDPAAASRILESLGLTPRFVYEKYRTEYHWPRSPVFVVLDETPIGIYLEIEGQPRLIDQAANALGFTVKDYITDTYGGLYQQYCKSRHIAPGNMVFAESSFGQIKLQEL